MPGPTAGPGAMLTLTDGPNGFKHRHENGPRKLSTHLPKMQVLEGAGRLRGVRFHGLFQVLN